MALDFVQQALDPSAAPLLPDTAQMRARRRRAATRPGLKWRQAVLEIVDDALEQIERVPAEETSKLWRREARQRALNFAALGLGELNLEGERFDSGAVCNLGGVYRLLARCEGAEPVQSTHILRGFLINLALAYAPFCGNIRLDLDLQSLIQRPIACRALILCIGTLVQGVMRRMPGAGGRLQADISEEACQHVLRLELAGRPVQLIGTPEYDLASRLCGVFDCELACNDAGNNGVKIRLAFPVLS